MDNSVVINDIKNIIEMVENRFDELDDLLKSLHKCANNIRAYMGDGIGSYEDIEAETKKVMLELMDSPIGGIIEVLERQ